MRWAISLAAIVVMAAACYGPDPNLTESGKGKPVVEVSFPDSVEPGTSHELEIAIENPGPGDMGTFVVAFAYVGPADAGSPLPQALIPVGHDRSNPAVASISPKPRAVSDDGVLYVFEGLDEGDSTTVIFEIVVPEIKGEAANSVTVYDGGDPERAAGARLQTQVT